MLQKPTYQFLLDELETLLKCKMNVYYALGKGDAGDIPTTMEEALALYSGVAPVFASLGNLDEDPISITYKYDTKMLNSGTRRIRKVVTATVKSVAVYDRAITMLSSDELKGEISLLFVPFNNPDEADVSEDYPAKFVLLNGLRAMHSGEGNANDELCNFTLTATARPKQIQDVVHILTLEA